MGEMSQPVTPSFNRSSLHEGQVEQPTGDPVSVLVRGIHERDDMTGWTTALLKDPRSLMDITHGLSVPIWTSILLTAHGCVTSTILNRFAVTLPRCRVSRRFRSKSAKGRACGKSGDRGGSKAQGREVLRVKKSSCVRIPH